MKKVLIIYNSKTGTTAKFAREIESYLKSEKHEVVCKQILDYDQKLLEGVDYLLLGCWTSGLMVICQHPQKIWKQFAKSLPDLKNMKVGLFTTYKILTGSMFKRMQSKLKNKISGTDLLIKSKDSDLSDLNKNLLKKFIC